MATTKRIKVRAGDTEPLELQMTATAGEEITTSDISSAALYARKVGASSNHVDGVALSSVTASSTDNGDGTWAVTINGTFDPASNKNGGGDAFDAAGSYDCYVLVTYTDSDETRHPGEENQLHIVVAPNYEG